METLQRTANRGSVSTGYNISNSVKLEADNNEWFYNASPTAGNRRTYTYSFWIKRTGLGTVNASGNQYVMGAGQHGRMFFGSDTFQYRFDDGHVCRNVSRKFRDASAWYHFVVAVDTTQSTASDRVKLYVNGDTLEVDDHDGGGFPDQNDEGAFFSTNYYTLGTGAFGGSYNAGDGGYDMRAYLAEVVAIDGQQLTPTSFGEYDSNGIWIAKDVSGLTFGSQGFYLTFETAGDMGDDKSGNGNDLSENNLTSADQSLDVPSNNFCTGNDLVNFSPGSQTLNQGAAKFANPASQNWQTITGTFGLSAGKWYWEFESDGGGAFVGISDVEDDIIPQNTNGYFLGYGDNDSSTTNSLGMYSSNGVIYNDNSGATGNSYGSGNRVGVALDMDNEKIYFAVDNNWVNSADPAAGTNGATWNSSWSDTVFPAGSCAQNNSIFFGYGGFSGLGAGNTNLTNSDANGYGAFKYSPPSGFYALCTKNLAEYG